MTEWQKQRSERTARLEAGSRYATGKVVLPESTQALLEAVIRPGDRVCLEGDNQKKPISSPRFWQALTHRESTIFIACDRESFSKPISTCSRGSVRSCADCQRQLFSHCAAHDEAITRRAMRLARRKRRRRAVAGEVLRMR